MISSGFSFAGNILKKSVTLLFLLLFFCSLAGQEKSTRQSATNAFNEEDYNLAYRQFSELLVSYPKDPVYKYYKAACMVYLEADPTESVKLLTEARQSASLSRPLPLESSFLLGRAKQQAALFSDAISSYNEYTDLAGKKASRDLGVPNYISQCEVGEGALRVPYKVIEVNDNEEVVALRVQIPEERENRTVEPISAQLTNVVAPTSVRVTMERELMPADYDALLAEAVLYQKKTDSLSLLIDKQQTGLNSLSARERASVTVEIGRNRVLADSLQTIADDKFEEAQSLINSSKFSVEQALTPRQSESIIQQPSLQQESMRQPVSQQESSEQPKQLQEAQAQPSSLIQRQDSTRNLVQEEKEAESENISVTRTDTVRLPEDTGAAIGSIVAQSVKALPGVTSLFEVDNKLASSRDEVIINPELPQGLVYRIQVAILRNPANQSTFKGLSPVYGLRDVSSTSTKYYVGLFRTRADANAALNEVKKVGFTDAFIIALLSGNSISTERAASLEKEWESVPFAYTDVGVQDVVADTVPPVLSYRVELIRVKQPVKEDQLINMRRIAGTRGMDIFTMQNGDIVYLVGTFVTYDSAAEYADLVSRNGFPDAKVAAWLGRREIPLETARQLFEMI